MQAPQLYGSLSAASMLISLLLAAGCGGNEYAAPPPPSVTVQRPTVRTVTEYAEYTGTTRAVELVEIRARVKGFLVSREFEPGQFLEQGASLFVIDPEPFEVAVQSAQAELASNQAELALKQTEFERIGVMFKRKATSELNLIRATAERDKARAAVSSSQANLHRAQLDYDYAHVEAPIAGRVGRHRVDVGNLVGSGEATLLTEMIRYSPLYVYFYISERDLLAFQRDSAHRREIEGADYDNRRPTIIQVGRTDQEGYPQQGTIDYTALELDADSGTFEVRGILPNDGAPDEVIIPGTFVRVRVPIGELKDAILVSDRALGADQSGRFVLVVNQEDIVEQRRVQIGALIDGLRVIEKGLIATERVIVKGLQRARPGAAVSPEQMGEEIGATRPGIGGGGANAGVSRSDRAKEVELVALAQDG